MSKTIGRALLLTLPGLFLFDLAAAQTPTLKKPAVRPELAKPVLKRPLAVLLQDGFSEMRRVAETNGDLIIAVHYTYASQNGDDVAIGVDALGAGGGRLANVGYTPWRMHAGSDWAYVKLTNTGTSARTMNKVRVKMYNLDGTFYTQEFDLSKTLQPQQDFVKYWTVKQVSATAKDFTFDANYQLRTTHGPAVHMGAYSLTGGVRSGEHGFGPSSALARVDNGTARVRLSYIRSGVAKSDAMLVALYEGGGAAFSYNVVPRVKYWSDQLADSDGDGISNANEAELFLNTNDKDTDDDGLEDGWELEGYPWGGYVYGDSNLPLYGANARHKDVFVQVDYLKAADHQHRMFTPSVHKAKGTYNALAIANPDGRNGIALHVVHSSAIDYDGVIGGVCGQRDYLSYFPQRKQRIYHWTIAGHGTGGQGEVASNRFVFGTGNGTPASGAGSAYDQYLAYAVFSHELGHNLGIQHFGGGTNQSNCKANYPSMMNYAYDYTNVKADGSCSGYTLADTAINFSTGGAQTLSEGALVERNSWNAASTFLGCYDSDFNGANYYGLNNDDVDWNRNGSFNAGTVSVDITAPSCGAGDGIKANQQDFNDAAIIAAKIAYSIETQPRAYCEGSGPSAGFHAGDTANLEAVCGIPEYGPASEHPYLKINPVFLVTPETVILHPQLRRTLAPVLGANMKLRPEFSAIVTPAQTASRIRQVQKLDDTPERALTPIEQDLRQNQ